MPATPEITFLPLKESHLPLLRRWLAEPHVAEFWQESEDEKEFRGKYLQKLADRGVSPFLIAAGGAPIGYIQHYNAQLVGGGWWPEAIAGTYGIDQYIGDPNWIGKGFGTAATRKMLGNLFSDPSVQEIICDPDPKNMRAIHVYEKIGFRCRGKIQTPGGDALLMTIRREH